MTEDKVFNKVVIITKDNAEYLLWVKEEYDDGTKRTEKINSKPYKGKGREKYSALFDIKNGLKQIKKCEFYIQDGSKNKSKFSQILENSSLNKNTVLAIHFGERIGVEKFPENEAKILNELINIDKDKAKLGAYLAYSLGNDIPSGVNGIFNTIAQKDIEPEGINEQYNKLFKIFIKEGLRFEYNRWIYVVENIKSGLSVWKLLEELPGRIKDDEVIMKQKKILDYIKKIKADNPTLKDKLDFNADNKDMEELHKRLCRLEKELSAKRDALMVP